ncbi:MAG TPA: hypothetical protein VFU50_06825 [Terriglobales bacterium]|nr:hypothetical protein [Terriglobales bacterium]
MPQRRIASCSDLGGDKLAAFAIRHLWLRIRAVIQCSVFAVNELPPKYYGLRLAEYYGLRQLA